MRPGRGQDIPGLFLHFQSKTLEELEGIFTETTEAQELAAGIGDVAEARQWLRTRLQAVGEKAGFPSISGKAWGRTTLPASPLPPLILSVHTSRPGSSAAALSHRAFQWPGSSVSGCSWSPRVPWQTSCGQTQGWVAVLLAREESSLRGWGCPHDPGPAYVTVTSCSKGC